MDVGAWYTHGYRKGMAGTLGRSLDLASDTIGWAIRSYKYELVYRGLRGAMVLDLPEFGDAMATQVAIFQNQEGLTVDRVIGPATSERLLETRLRDVADLYALDYRIVRGIVRHESAFDLGAIGYVDHDDRGLTQQHLWPDSTITLSQAIRPAMALPRLAAQIRRLRLALDEDAAIASWNCGEGGAEWWFDAGKPAEGSPSWWHADIGLAERATAYVAAIRQ